MKRRILIAAAALLLLAPLAAGLALNAFLDSDRLRHAIERQASAWLEAPVRIGGASAAVWPRVGLRLRDVEVEARAGRLTAEDVRVETGLRPLLARRVEGATVRVAGGRIVVSRDPSAAPVAPPANPTPPSSSASRAGSAATAAERAPEDAAAPFVVASVSEIAVEALQIVAGARTIRADLHGALDGGRLDVRSASLETGGTRVDLSGALSSLAPPAGELALTSAFVDVGELVAAIGAVADAVPADGGQGRDGRGERAAPLVVRAEVARGRLLEHEVADVAAVFSVSGGDMHADSLDLSAYGGRYSSDVLRLERDGGGARIDLRGRGTGLDLAALLARLGQSGAATGRLAADLTASGAGGDAEAAAKALRGTARIRIEDGTVPRLEVVRSSFAVLGAPPPGKDGEGERFDAITGTVSFGDGSRRIDDLALQSADYDLRGQLAIDPAGRLSGDVDVVLSEALSREAQRKNRDLRLTFEDRRIVLPAKVSGTLTDPVVMPDLADAIRRAAGNRVRQELEKQKDRLRDRLQDLLKRPPRD